MISVLSEYQPRPDPYKHHLRSEETPCTLPQCSFAGSPNWEYATLLRSRRAPLNVTRFRIIDRPGADKLRPPELRSFIRASESPQQTGSGTFGIIGISLAARPCVAQCVSGMPRRPKLVYHNICGGRARGHVHGERLGHARAHPSGAGRA